LVPRTQEKVSRRTGASKCSTWFSACTPLSVRPAQTVGTGAAAKLPSARSTRSCNVRPCGCDCQPW
jgi:hypothetical protein